MAEPTPLTEMRPICRDRGCEKPDLLRRAEAAEAALAEAVGLLRDIRQTLRHAAERGVTLTGPNVERIDALLSETPEGTG